MAPKPVRLLELAPFWLNNNYQLIISLLMRETDTFSQFVQLKQYALMIVCYNALH